MSPPLREKFGPGRPLRQVLRICTASLVMYHQDVYREFGAACPIHTKLCETARQVKIEDSRFPNAAPETILNRWSEIVREDYKAQNPEIAPATEDLSSIMTIVNQQSEMLLQLHSMVRIMANREEERRQFRASQDEIEWRSKVSRSMTDIKTGVAHVEAKMAVFHTRRGTNSEGLME